MKHIKIRLLALILMAAFAPNMLNCMSTKQKADTKKAITDNLAIDPANFTDDIKNNTQTLIDKLKTVEKGTAQGFQDRLNDKIAARNAALGSTQALAAEKTRREATERDLATLRTTLQDTESSLKTMQQARKTYDAEKQKNSGALSKNELERKRLQAELAALATTGKLSADDIAKKAQQIATLTTQQNQLRQQLEKQEEELREQARRLEAKEQALLLQSGRVAASTTESNRLATDLKDTREQLDAVTDVMLDKANEVLAREKQLAEQRTTLLQQQEVLNTREAELQAQLEKTNLTEQEKQSLQAQLNIAQKTEAALRNINEQLHKDYSAIQNELSDQINNLNDQIARNSSTLNDNKALTNDLEKEITQLRLQAQTASQSEKKEIAALVNQKEDLQKQYEEMISRANEEVKAQHDIITRLEDEKQTIKEQQAQEKKKAQEDLQKLQNQLATQQREAEETKNRLGELNYKLAAGSLQKTQQLKDEIKALEEKLTLAAGHELTTQALITSAINDTQAIYEDDLREKQSEIKKLQQQIQELKAKPQTEAVKQEIKHKQEEKKETEEDRISLQKEQEKNQKIRTDLIGTHIATIRSSLSLMKSASVDLAQKFIQSSKNNILELENLLSSLTKQEPYKQQVEDVKKAVQDAENDLKKRLTEQKPSVESKRSDEKKEDEEAQKAAIKAYTTLNLQLSNLIRESSKSLRSDDLSNAKISAQKARQTFTDIKKLDINKLKKYEAEINTTETSLKNIEESIKTREAAIEEKKQREEKTEADKNKPTTSIEQQSETELQKTLENNQKSAESTMRRVKGALEDNDNNKAQDALNDAKKASKNFSESIALLRKNDPTQAKWQATLSSLNDQIKQAEEALKKAEQKPSVESKRSEESNIPDAPSMDGFNDASEKIENISQNQDITPITNEIKESKAKLTLLKTAYNLTPNKNSDRAKSLKFKIDALEKSKNKLIKAIEDLTKTVKSKALNDRLKEIRAIVGYENDEEDED